MPEKHAKIVCGVEGYTDIWIQLNVTDWGLHEFIDIPTCTWMERIQKYIPKYAVDWHMVADDGAIIPLPKTKIYDSLWQQAFKRIGSRTSQAIWTWLQAVAITAVGEAMTPSPKSESGDDGNGDGDEPQPAG